MHGVGIGGRVHRDGGDAELLAGALDAQRDLAPVGDQNLVEHSLFRAIGKRQSGSSGRASILLPIAYCLLPSLPYSMMTSGSPNSTGWPFSNRIAVTVPARGAGIWFIVFMASMISSVSPWLTRLPISMNGGGAGLGRAVGGADHRRFDGARMLGRVGRAAGAGPDRRLRVLGAAGAAATTDWTRHGQRARRGS